MKSIEEFENEKIDMKGTNVYGGDTFRECKEDTNVGSSCDVETIYSDDEGNNPIVVMSEVECQEDA